MLAELQPAARESTREAHFRIPAHYVTALEDQGSVSSLSYAGGALDVAKSSASARGRLERLRAGQWRPRLDRGLLLVEAVLSRMQFSLCTLESIFMAYSKLRALSALFRPVFPTTDGVFRAVR